MEKLKAFRHLFGKVSDEKIAGMAGVTVEEVRIARAEADAGTGDPDTGTGDTADADSGGDSSGGDTADSSGGDSGGDTTDVNITGSTGSDSEHAALVGKVAELERALAVKKIELERAREQIGMLEERLLVAAEKRPVEKPQPAAEKPAPGPEQPTPAPKPEPENPAPSSVRVVRNAEIPRGPDGRRWTLGFRDVYSGEQARWLWEKHPALVEPYPPAK